ncbi:hypothetical protein B0H17DRAFT_1199506 [Mycena rosella]|uniref:RRM domain-containing protein n=1 Tax=Mycena rosella TaxID=1033263 RepID=A0AAD7DNI7_MYCRO|nr:hypothetical protein B0H17DRAFT_1199506 [Mycena rosella]
MPYTALHPPPSDEGFLNKSLLDQLDAQADAEPVSSSASDDSSHGSPHVPYHAPSHVQDTHDYPQPKMASFYPRASFTAFPNATRRQPYREPPSATAPQFYPAAAEAFAPQLTSPVLQPYDPRASFDFKAASYPPPPADYPPPQQTKLNGYAAPYVNGMHSQTPYGPHVPAMGPINGAGAGLPPPAMLGSMQEDISTIFVVGFPEDMQEREFQNMFTFSPGFEAATLKIPNKEYTAYSGVLLPSTYPGQQQQQQRALGGAGQYNSYAGSHDPYNLVTVNQGGVVVDAGRDGIASWPAAPPLPPASSSTLPPPSSSAAGDEAAQQPSQHQQGYGGAGGGAGGAAPRKQIIGFAKFRTREEALGARDVLQGRRVDIERGAVLKAEMAKKNLHTKRGVGPVGGGGSGGMNMNGGMGYGEALSPREMGIPATHTQTQTHPGTGLANLTNGHSMNPNATSNGARMAAQWRESQVQLEEEEAERDRDRERERERERRQAGVLSAMGLRGERRPPQQPRAFADTPGPWDAVRRRSPSPDAGGYEATAGHGYEGYGFAEAPRAFSSPPPHAHNFGYAGGAGYAPFMGTPTHHEGYAMQQQHEQEQQQQQQQQQYHRQAQEYHEQYEAPRRQERSESSASEGSAAGELERGMARLAQRPGTPSSNGNTNSAGTPANNSPPVTNAISNPNAPITIPGSGTGSAGSGSGGGSPQLASPASSGAGRAVDQNPPINTLYVGNLPALGAGATSSSTPTMEHLEGALRELFGACAGFRQMSFRPKGNGPMCFVEFEDVSYATKTLNELYGHTLGGLIKGGGIRLSYSKNPLGVRTPTSAGGGGMREQQMQGMGVQQGMNVQQPGMSLQQNLQQQQMLAEAAFHPRLTSPPPQPEGAVTAPRFFGEGGGAWGRRWESEHRGARGSVSATGAGFAPFVPEQADAQ